MGNSKLQHVFLNLSRPHLSHRYLLELRDNTAFGHHRDRTGVTCPLNPSGTPPLRGGTDAYLQSEIPLSQPERLAPHALSFPRAIELNEPGSRGSLYFRRVTLFGVQRGSPCPHTRWSCRDMPVNNSYIGLSPQLPHQHLIHLSPRPQLSLKQLTICDNSLPHPSLFRLCLSTRSRPLLSAKALTRCAYRDFSRGCGNLPEWKPMRASSRSWLRGCSPTWTLASPPSTWLIVSQAAM